MCNYRRTNMSIGAIKEDSETLRRVGDLLRNGKQDEAYDLMAQSFGPNSVEALKKAMSYGISPEKLGELLTKAPLMIERFQERMKKRGKDQAMAKEVEELAKQQKKAMEQAKKEAAERQKRFEERMNHWDKKRHQILGKHHKLDEEEKRLKEKLGKEKNADKRRKYEEKLRKIQERRKILEEERKKLEEIVKNIRNEYNQTPENQKKSSTQTQVSPQVVQQSRGGR